jgi:hypothetical protein
MVNHQPSTINHQPSTINPWCISRQPSTIPKRSTHPITPSINSQDLYAISHHQHRCILLLSTSEVIAKPIDVSQ